MFVIVLIAKPLPSSGIHSLLSYCCCLFCYFEGKLDFPTGCRHIFNSKGQDALTKEERKRCVCVSPSGAIVSQRAFKRNVLNGASEVRSISGAAVTYFTQPGS